MVDGLMDLTIHIDRELGVLVHLSVAPGTTVGALKRELAKSDPTNQTDPCNIGLKLPSPCKTSLQDDEPIPKGSTELDLCMVVTHPEAAQEASHAVVAEHSIRVPDKKSQVNVVDLQKPVSSRVKIITQAGAFQDLEIQADCTVSQLKRQLGDGTLLGDKVLYSGKLTCYAEVSNGEAGPVLGEDVRLPTHPASVVVFGPPAVVTSLEMALKKKLGPPDPQRQARQAATAPTDAPPWPSTQSGKDDWFEFCYVGLQGHREYMEDRACAFLQLPNCKTAAFFGVFDGHGGEKVADLVTRHLPDIVGKELKSSKDPVTALERSFFTADDGIQAALKQNPHMFDLVGTTAVTTLILREANKLRLLCANCGDSRAVLCHRGQATDVSHDHKPQDSSERERIEAAGANIDMTGRINGGLNLSRALGDFGYKRRRDLPPDRQQVISRPEVQIVELDGSHEFVVMGSDGVFDIFESDELVSRLHQAIVVRAEPMEHAIRAILQESLGSGDNVTLCVVRFLKSVPRN